MTQGSPTSLGVGADEMPNCDYPCGWGNIAPPPAPAVDLSEKHSDPTVGLHTVADLRRGKWRRPRSDRRDPAVPR